MAEAIFYKLTSNDHGYNTSVRKKQGKSEPTQEQEDAEGFSIIYGRGADTRVCGGHPVLSLYGVDYPIKVMTKILLKCKEEGCGKEFYFSDQEQKFYKEKGYATPKRCWECRDNRRNRGQYSPFSGVLKEIRDKDLLA